MNRIYLKLLETVFIFSLTVALYGTEEDKMLYKDPNVPVEQRVNDLLKRMTLDEKISQMCMTNLSKLEFDINGKVSDESLEELFNGQSIGCLESPFIGVRDIAKLSQVADRYLREKTRLGIPAIQIAECVHGQLALGATIFPQAIAQGSTWNPELIHKMAEIIAREASASGVDQALSPIFDLARDPRFGRVEECYGEDPYLVSRMGVAFVIGMQGKPEITCKTIPDNHLMCTAKAFVAYSVPAAGINLGPVSVGERELRSSHFVPFEAAVKDANIYSLMPGYHEVDGIPVHASSFLLRDVLRNEWGFNGYVFSDYEAIRMLEHFHCVAGNREDAALQAALAGVDLEAPSSYAYTELKKLVEDGKLDKKVIDEAVRNILRVKFKAGLFDKTQPSLGKITENVHLPEHIALAREIAAESVILLKNDNNLLPLNPERINSIAVIGPNADQVQFGDYSITKHNDYGIAVLDGIQQIAGSKIQINYARGCGITDLDKSGFDEAVDAAQKSDVVILVIGGTSIIYSGIGWGNDQSDKYNTCGEGLDRTTLCPPGVQPELIKEIVKTGKPVVMVMIHGRPYSIIWEKEHIPAILEAWYPGEEGGNAIADILFGIVNPSGKLTVSVPQSVGHVPVSYDHKPSGRGFYHKPGTPEKPGRDYVFSSPDPLFPFGYGLSYTEFKYSNLKISN
ncbi:MAG: glycoside hydrolase family 3 C-terminal domain-containing protein, partial [Bacteroidales bacterium]|nr:glycoside hydrolase family 3 C-terminal domain-containing protein [Bacteroidales bacterium]